MKYLPEVKSFLSSYITYITYGLVRVHNLYCLQYLLLL